MARMLAILAGTASMTWAEPSSLPLDQASFKNPPAQDRTRMFWRVFGPTWTNPEIDYRWS